MVQKSKKKSSTGFNESLTLYKDAPQVLFLLHSRPMAEPRRAANRSHDSTARVAQTRGNKYINMVCQPIRSKTLAHFEGFNPYWSSFTATAARRWRDDPGNCVPNN
jgi:hypothetical protein